MTAQTEATSEKVEPQINAVGSKSGGGKKFVFYGLLILFAILYIYPFVIQLVTSFKTNPDATNNALSVVPGPVTTSAWDTLFGSDYPIWFTNSVIVTLSVTVGRV